jgi:hypothetical protein
MNRSPGKRAPAGREGSTARRAVSPGEPEPAPTTLVQARHQEGGQPGARRKHRDPGR